MTADKTRLWLILAFFGLVIVGSAFALFFQFSIQYGTTAQIYLEDQLVEQVDLNAVTTPYTVAVGAGNTALVEHGAISMHSADCPDQLCVKQGKITGGVYPIVCLPNRVTIKIISKTADAPDVIAGGIGS